ncbi:Ser/Thr protein kinase RdoA (MazF antagonist) [Variovorax boronicumulans]|uniref:phosphotransferase enzyme family protein n=1 Tax=Variovorax boronicumulans TaxID=436515 RepID=UPI002472EB78|nr:phosphotransferase [Variovorax boronicumulans]MDH6166432.1 Ser/Thr protein kinase RdoA (MazF antagonist) [Variovorax boronicumulans]
MPDIQPHDPHLVPAHTTAAAISVARWVAQHHDFQVEQCHLIRRGLNDNYAVRSADGTRYVARLYSIRPRGGFNVDFEVALLAHLEAKGVGVAASVPGANGQAHIQLQFPEGPRALALFRHAEGSIPETLDDFELTGRALAHIHEAARDYAGPPSRYTLDGHHLAGRTLGYLRSYPELGSDLFETYSRLAHRLLEELAAAEGGLTRVICHGDTHGFNNHVDTDAAGTRRTAFFDFDDAGPGFLAYDLGVMPWSYLFRKTLKEPDDALRERWMRYLRGYRAGGGEVSERDLAALPLFIQLRHLWNLGEAAGRLHHWGTNSAPVDWLRKQVDVFEAWRGLDLRA